MDTSFKIVTGPENHTGTAIFYHDGYAVHITPRRGKEPSSINVYPVDSHGVHAGAVAFTCPATLKNLCAARAFINHANAGGTGLPGPDGEILPTPEGSTDPDETGIYPTITDHVERLRLPLPSKV